MRNNRAATFASRTNAYLGKLGFACIIANHSPDEDGSMQDPNINDRRARRIKPACDALGISRSHLYALAKRGRIRLVRLGGRTVVPESEIERVLREGA